MKTTFKSADSLPTKHREMSIFSNVRGCSLANGHASSSWLSALFAGMPYNREINESLVCPY